MIRFIRSTHLQSHPDTVFWSGALNGVIVLILLFAFLAGYFFNAGANAYLMGGAFAGAALLLFLAFRFLFALLRIGLNKVPISLFSIFLAALVLFYLIKLSGFYLPETVYFPAIGLGILAQVFIFGSLNHFITNKSYRSGFHVTLLVVGLGIDGFGIHWITSKGTNQPETGFRQVQVSQLTGIANPSEAGNFAVAHFTYGSGTDRHRQEFRSGVRYRTQPVDATPILHAWEGSAAKWREKFWGFDAKALPLNGRVWMPEGEGSFPLMLIVHGNSSIEKFSDPGYAYLGELLASRGFVAVSVDQNFVNGTWSGDFRGLEMPTRGWMLLKHLAQWQDWNQDRHHDLFGKIDMDNIILAGHSRGGEAVAIAASFNKLAFFPDNARLQFDFNFNIKGIVEIAPTDKRYFRRLSLENINYLSLQGSYDSDEASFFGLRQYRRIDFTDSQYWFKAGLYIHRANHSQFNTVWGEKDSEPPYGWLLDVNSVIDGEAQRQIAKVYIAAFAEVLFNDKVEYLPIFKNAAMISDWLPETIYLNNFKDSRKLVIADFEEDIDLTTARQGSITARNLAVWREEPLQFRNRDTQGNNALVLGWDSSADSIATEKSYELILDDPIDLGAIDSLLVSMAAGDPNELNTAGKTGNTSHDTGASALNFTIQLTDTAGNQLSIASDALKKIAPRLMINYMKLKSLNRNLGDSWELSLESFEYLLADFDGETEHFGLLHAIAFKFNRADHGVLIIDDLGFSLH